MTKLGLYVWLERVHTWAGSKTFAFSELPPELRSQADIKLAANRGFVECIGKTGTSAGTRKSIYKVTRKTKVRFA